MIHSIPPLSIRKKKNNKKARMIGGHAWRAFPTVIDSFMLKFDCRLILPSLPVKFLNTVEWYDNMSYVALHTMQ